MIDPNRGASQSVLDRHREASYERFRIELFEAVKSLLRDFDMTWDDLADRLAWPSNETYQSGDGVREAIGQQDLSLEELNEIAHVFSAEPYIIFRPRAPWVQT